MAEKKLSKKELAKLAEKGRRQDDARAAAERAKTKKQKKDKPTRCKIMPCNCVSVRGIQVKNPGIAGPIAIAGYYPVPIHLMDSGAKFQDRRCGEGQRLHNPGYAKGKLVTWTCTVCGDVKRV